MKRGFTLIELLVVVLIIGILAAVALPGYQKAVEKSKMTQALTIANALQKGMDAYILENGVRAGGPQTDEGFGDLIDDLGVDPGGSEWGYANNFYAELGTDDVRRIREFAYAANCFHSQCRVLVAKFKEASELMGGHTIEYVITYTYTTAQGWTKAYRQYNNAKANLKPEFQALGFSTN